MRIKSKIKSASGKFWGVLVFVSFSRKTSTPSRPRVNANSALNSHLRNPTRKVPRQNAGKNLCQTKMHSS
ncbi:MAG: hypothetical protein A3C44_03555 [Gammaproteobacteria bacterium RIFCSPHIGHO2_02_FULL_39_13]|nr:MAG: hypothetical protein A3C44_03555 [Gammaproteobacteria bacterium RIFCSPHIGHO2_02_FULL_39_13]OGT49940.1 MAG: hypothetical protein A3E53_06165 [Gammaproteobacteria bacterium RIFCSPHIGHO2_12_FULL_39_24]